MSVKAILILNTTKHLSNLKGRAQKNESMDPTVIQPTQKILQAILYPLFSNFKAVYKWNTDMKHKEHSRLRYKTENQAKSKPIL